MEALFLEPAFKDYIWGGTALKTVLGKQSNLERIAESWEISTNKAGECLIKNGEYKGKTLTELFQNPALKQNIFGTKSLKLTEFPILIKFIDANDNLSVQVHPDDAFAKKYENSLGKSELWYIIDCKKDAKLICGLKDDITNNLEEILENNTLEDHLHYVDVKKGDYIYIPSGTVHAILNGILLCEIQQNSNITYRIYDWNRVDKNGNKRELHQKKAKQVINLNNQLKVQHSSSLHYQNLVNTPYFLTDLLTINSLYENTTQNDSFYAFNVIEGRGSLKIKGHLYELNIGDSFLIPAALGEYQIIGNLKLLKTFI